MRLGCWWLRRGMKIRIGWCIVGWMLLDEAGDRCRSWSEIAREEWVCSRLIRFAGLGAADASIVVSCHTTNRVAESGVRKPTEESGLQTPPTRDTPIKESGLQTPPTEEITIPFPEEIHVDVGVSSLHPFLFLLLKQQKPRTFMLPKGLRLSACCLTILIYTV